MSGFMNVIKSFICEVRDRVRILEPTRLKSMKNTVEIPPLPHLISFDVLNLTLQDQLHLWTTIKIHLIHIFWTFDDHFSDVLFIFDRINFYFVLEAPANDL